MNAAHIPYELHSSLAIPSDGYSGIRNVQMGFLSLKKPDLYENTDPPYRLIFFCT
jgi:hypothetical protein